MERKQVMTGRIRQIMLVLWQAGFPLLIYLAVGEMVFGIWSLFPGQVRQEQNLPLTAAAGAIASVPLGIEYKRWKTRTGDKGRISRKAVICAVISGVGACLFFNGMMMLLPLQKEGYRRVSQALYQPSLLVQLVCMGGVIPIGEELVFRGLGYGRMRQELSFPAALAVSAVWFGLNHGNLVQGIYAGLLGIFLAVLYEKSKSLAVCTLFHGTANVTAVVMTRLLSKGQLDQTAGQAAAMMAAGGFLLAALYMVLCMKIRREGIWK